MIGKRANYWDIAIIICILLLAGGSIGGALRPIRAFSVLFAPVLFFKARHIRFAKSVEVTCLVFWLFCIFSLLWTPSFSEGVNEIIYYAVHLCLFFEIVLFATLAKNPLTSITTGWSLFVLFCSIIAIWEISTGDHLSMAYDEQQSVNIEGVISTRMMASVTFANINGYVTALCMATPWLYYKLLSDTTSNRIKTLTVLLLLVSFLTTLINGSRGGIITMVGMALLFFIKFGDRKKKIIGGAFILLVITYILISFYEELFLIISMRASISSEFQQGDGLSEGRLAIWMTALRILWDTMGIGVGCGGMTEAMVAYRTNSNIISLTHNMFVEILLQYGIIWFLIFVLFLFRLFVKTNSIKDQKRRIPLQLALWLMPVYLIIDSIYLLDPITYVLFASIFCFVNYNRINNNTVKTS